jgi:hypothetical protein
VRDSNFGTIRVSCSGKVPGIGQKKSCNLSLVFKRGSEAELINYSSSSCAKDFGSFKDFVASRTYKLRARSARSSRVQCQKPFFRVLALFKTRTLELINYSSRSRWKSL